MTASLSAVAVHATGCSILIALAAPPADRLPALPAEAQAGEFDAPPVGRRLKYAVLLPADYATPEQAAGWNPFALATRIDPMTCPHLHLDCGTADTALADSRELADLPRRRKLPYSYLELPGGHAPPYWRDAARHWLRVVADRLR